MAEDNDREKVSIGAKVTPEFKTAVRTLAAANDKSMSEFVREAVHEKYAREKGQMELTLDDFKESESSVEGDEEGNGIQTTVTAD